MKAETRKIRDEYLKDSHAMLHHNNSKWMKQTPEEREQSVIDKKKYYKTKWEEIQSSATTKVQKEYCKMALNFVDKIC